MRRSLSGSRPSPPSTSGRGRGEPSEEADLAIEIDPELIEAALAAVDRRKGHSANPPRADDAPLEEGADGTEAGTTTHSGAARPVKLDDDAALIELIMPDDEPGVQELVVPPELAELMDDVPAVPPAPPPTKLLLARLEMQKAQIARLEAQTRDLMSGRDALNGQVQDLRIAGSELAADFERFRQRARRERDDAERRGEERLLAPLLDMAENLERAAAHAGPDGGALARGVLMVLEQLRSQLKRLGVERVASARGERFDPEQHEALQRIPTGGVPSDHIVDELAPGYRYRGRLLRPARVTVAAEPAAPAESEPTVTDTAETEAAATEAAATEAAATEAAVTEAAAQAADPPAFDSLDGLEETP